MNARSNSSWYWTPKPIEQPAVRLFCFPFACGGTLTYHKWPTYLPPTIEVVAVQLPGRERRYVEPPFRRLDALVDTLERVMPEDAHVPCAFFGHSMGALIAYELARTLHGKGHPCAPRKLLVSGRRAPHINRHGQQILHTLPRPELIRSLRELGGTPGAVFEEPDLLEMVLTLARADFELVETYQYRAGPPLPCPITAFRGIDDPEVSADEAAAWEIHTSSRFKLHALPGNHFFLNTATRRLLTFIADELGPEQSQIP